MARKDRQRLVRRHRSAAPRDGRIGDTRTSFHLQSIASRRPGVPPSRCRATHRASLRESRPSRASSFPRFARLTPPARLADPCLRAPLAEKQACVGGREGAVLLCPFTVSRRSRRARAARALRACVLAAVCRFYGNPQFRQSGAARVAVSGDGRNGDRGRAGDGHQVRSSGRRDRHGDGAGL